MDDKRKAEQAARDHVEKQARKFNAALEHGWADARKDRDIRAQSGNYARASAAVRLKELQARAVLMRHGLYRTQFMPYFRFVRHLWSASKLYWADDFHLLAGAAVARWTGQGCNREILKEILFDVFNVKVREEGGAG